MTDLTDARDHARKMAETDVSKARRELWALLRDEYDEHLDRHGDPVEPAPEDGPGLFEEGS